MEKPINHTTGGGVLGNFIPVETFGARNTQSNSLLLLCEVRLPQNLIEASMDCGA